MSIWKGFAFRPFLQKRANIRKQQTGLHTAFCLRNYLDVFISLAVIIGVVFLSGEGQSAGKIKCTDQPFLENDQVMDMFCLHAYYPQIGDIYRDNAGNQWLCLADGGKVPYLQKGIQGHGLAVDMATSLETPYMLEPMRPDTPQGYAPGRKRCYEFLKAIYGADSASVSRSLKTINFMGKNLKVAPAVARALAKAEANLPKTREMQSWLKPDGAYYWRTIAGENVLSAHSFGIAVDLGVKKSPYWRWSRIMPHPLQKDYPGEIVMAMEEQGFIWGGKWHEYDLMHFEYRPELICKARLKQARMARPQAANQD